MTMQLKDIIDKDEREIRSLLQDGLESVKSKFHEAQTGESLIRDVHNSESSMLQGKDATVSIELMHTLKQKYESTLSERGGADGK